MSESITYIYKKEIKEMYGKQIERLKKIVRKVYRSFSETLNASDCLTSIEIANIVERPCFYYINGNAVTGRLVIKHEMLDAPSKILEYMIGKKIIGMSIYDGEPEDEEEEERGNEYYYELVKIHYPYYEQLERELSSFFMNTYIKKPEVKK